MKRNGKWKKYGIPSETDTPIKSLVVTPIESDILMTINGDKSITPSSKITKQKMRKRESQRGHLTDQN